MKHPNEEELIAYHGGEVLRRDAIAVHLTDCPECRAELERIDTVLAALSSMPIPESGGRLWRARLAANRSTTSGAASALVEFSHGSRPDGWLVYAAPLGSDGRNRSRGHRCVSGRACDQAS